LDPGSENADNASKRAKIGLEVVSCFAHLGLPKAAGLGRKSGYRCNENLGTSPLKEVDGALVKSLRGAQTQPQFVRNLDVSVDVLQKAENGLASERTIDVLFACKAAKALKLKRESFYKNPPQKTV
jgi:hypothetical protein